MPVQIPARNTNNGSACHPIPGDKQQAKNPIWHAKTHSHVFNTQEIPACLLSFGRHPRLKQSFLSPPIEVAHDVKWLQTLYFNTVALAGRPIGVLDKYENITMTDHPDIIREQIDAVGGQSRRYKSGLLHTIDLKNAHTCIDDRWIAQLEGQSKLKELNLSGTGISNMSLEVISQLESIETLDLSETAINDDAFAYLSSMHHLKVLVLTGSQVTQDRIREIRASMINTRIVYI